LVYFLAGLSRAIGALVLALAVVGAVKADAIGDLDELAARSAAPRVAVGQTISADGGSKDVAAPDVVPVGWTGDFAPGLVIRTTEERLHAFRDGAVPR
jgi:hypothetical protein